MPDQKHQKRDKLGRIHKGGMPKGHKTAKVIDKEEARAILREMVTEALRPMTHAQIAAASGIKFLMVREKLTGKFLKVGKDAAEKLNPNEEIIEVWEEKPSTPAFTDLLNRTLDKPTESVSMDATVNASADLMALLIEGRERARKA